MKAMPAYQLNPKMKNVWRISDTINSTILFLIFFIPMIFLYVLESERWALIVALIVFACFIVALIVFLVVLPPIRFARWRYELSNEYLDIARGIIWRKRFIIPFIRVQNTDTQQGPILRAFGLSSVTVSTAAGKHEIPGLDIEVAEQLRDKAAELARIAQEDV